jgi:predicted DNA-binding ribbon-helix-helix protein
MSTTINLPDEVYTRLEEQAKARGLTVSQTVAQLVEESQRARIVTAIERLRMKGLLAAPEPRPSTPAHFEPLKVQGQPLSEAIIEERR